MVAHNLQIIFAISGFDAILCKVEHLIDFVTSLEVLLPCLDYIVFTIMATGFYTLL
jgi:hypothetical protein